MKQQTNTPATPVQPTTVGELPEKIEIGINKVMKGDSGYIVPINVLNDMEVLAKVHTQKIEIGKELVRRYNAFPSLLEFIKNEDNHTEGEQGNSCIDVATLINFINNQ